jgi:predicted DNA-binding protein
MKALAIRLEDEEHQLLVLMARVNDRPLADELREAIQAHVARTRSEPDFAERARAILDEIDREAAARRTAITSLFGEPKGESGTEPAEGEQSPRRGTGPKSRKP